MEYAILRHHELNPQPGDGKIVARIKKYAEAERVARELRRVELARYRYAPFYTVIMIGKRQKS